MTKRPIKRDPDLDGNGRQRCIRCQHWAIAGFVKGRGLCPFHWADLCWGRTWAIRCHPTHPDAIPTLTATGDNREPLRTLERRLRRGGGAMTKRPIKGEDNAMTDYAGEEEN